MDKVVCLNCGYEQETEIESIFQDGLGYFIVCEKCDSSFDI